MLGDWNATPDDTGVYSPAWIARGASLRLVTAGAGRHGNIDYGLFRGVRVTHADRYPPPAGTTRSDHDVVTYQLERDGQPAFLLGTWNLRYGRPAESVGAQVRRVLHDHQLDVLVLQEAADYHRQLRLVPGYACHADPAPGRGHQVILVKYGHRIRHPKMLRTSPRGWTLVTGGRHRPLWVASLVVDDWLRVVDVHQPPSVNWRRGVPYGPPMRVAAYVASARRLLRIARGKSRP